MRVAVVHDFACQRGGAERVVLDLCRLLADPVVVTSLYVPEATYDELARYEVRAARVGTASDAERFRSRALSYAREFRSARVDDAELVIVSSSAFAHRIRHPRSLVYWHTPPRFLYDLSAYEPNRLLARAVTTGLAPLRRGDRHAALAHRGHAANSRRTAARLKAVYGIDARVIYPPLDVGRLPVTLRPVPEAPRALVVSRLLPYKRVDLAIKACARAELPLTVVGSGPDEARLRDLKEARGVRFLGAVGDEALGELYASHAVVVSPAIDDFGYVPIEAAYAGRPVVAADAGGTNENVRDYRTGRLVQGDDPWSWAEAILWVLEQDWSPEHLRAHAETFGEDVFAGRLRDFIGTLVDPAEVLRQPHGNRGPCAAPQEPAVTERVGTELSAAAG